MKKKILLINRYSKNKNTWSSSSSSSNININICIHAGHSIRLLTMFVYLLLLLFLFLFQRYFLIHNFRGKIDFIFINFQVLFSFIYKLISYIYTGVLIKLVGRIVDKRFSSNFFSFLLYLLKVYIQHLKNTKKTT